LENLEELGEILVGSSLGDLEEVGDIPDGD